MNGPTFNDAGGIKNAVVSNVKIAVGFPAGRIRDR